MRDRRQLLKIKLKSLAAEARIIRRAEQKLALPKTPHIAKAVRDATPSPQVKADAQARRLAIRVARSKARAAAWYDQNRAELREIHNHRVLDLRTEARATHLAYGFLRGRTYQQMEGNRIAPPKDSFAYITEQKLFEKAMKMVAVYGAVGTQTTVAHDFKTWQENGGLRLTYDGPVYRLDGQTSEPPSELGRLL